MLRFQISKHARVSQMVRDDTHGVRGCDAGRQWDETATKTGNSDCVSKRRCEGMVFEHCSSTTIEPRRWQKAVQLSLSSDTHVVGSQGSCCRHRGIRS